jgi:hypothetical protein
MCVCWCDETLSTSSFFVSSSFYPHFLAASIFSARLSLLQRLLEVYLSIPFSFLFLFPVCFLSTHWIPLHSVERDLCPKLSHLHTPMRCHMIIIAFRISFRKSLLVSLFYYCYFLFCCIPPILSRLGYRCANAFHQTRTHCRMKCLRRRRWRFTNCRSNGRAVSSPSFSLIIIHFPG